MKKQEDNLVSVIIPVFNTEKFLYQCVQSVQGQTYCNLEIILVNDGSTDESLEICKALAASDERIVVVNKKNGGISSARNAALDIAMGKWILFVDSDDYVDSNMIEHLVSAATSSGADVTLCGYTTVEENGNIIREYRPVKKEVLTGVESLQVHYFRDYNINFVTSWAKLYKKELWIGLRFLENIYYEDIEMMPRIFLKCQKVLVLPESGYYYLQRNGSVMHNKNALTEEKYYKDAITIFQQQIDLYDKNGLWDIRNEVMCLLLDKIMTSDIHNTIPNNCDNVSKELFKKYYSAVRSNAKQIGITRILRYCFYTCFGVRGYLIFSNGLKKCGKSN